MVAIRLPRRLGKAFRMMGDRDRRSYVLFGSVDNLAKYEPARAKWRRIWKQLSSASRRRRYGEALARKAVLDAAAGRPPGESERATVGRLKPAPDRSNFRRWKQRFEKYGFDGLVNWTVPPVPAAIPDEVRNAICTLRRADPQVDVAVIVEHVGQHHDFKTSETSVKRVLRAAGLERRRGPAPGKGNGPEKRLELGGMQLVSAALVKTGYLTALSEAVVAQMAATQVAPQPVDTSDRDALGRFLPSYNERLRKGADDSIGPGFASVETKRKKLDPSRLHLFKASAELVERKLAAVMMSPLLGGGRWDGIRVARGELLGELCGFPYMPATLELFTRELKYLGVSSTLWETHARLWMQQTRAWGAARHSTVLYVDETSKPVWTDLFSESSRVSSVGKVMPSLETVAFHSGYGVPLWMLTHSGRTPLVNVVPEMLGRFRTILGGSEIGRIVVIDAEGNSVPFLQGLEEGTPARAWVTRLKPSLVENKHIFNRTNYQAYRNGDRVRSGLVDLNNAEVAPQATFRIRVVEVERRSTGAVTYIGASTLLEERDWTAAELADLYFERWPNQEANFRAVNQALGLKDVHGYGKQLVDNVTVITELDEITQKSRNSEERLQKHINELDKENAALNEHGKKLRRLERQHATVTRQLGGRIADGQRITPKLRRLATEQQTTSEKIRKQTAAITRIQKKVERLSKQEERQRAALTQYEERRTILESRRRIFRHDVELDSLFSLLKVGLVLAITYVLKEFLGEASMEPATFFARVATLPARLLTLPRLEILTFEYNQRDPDVMALLSKNCEAINALKLRTRTGRVLRLQVDPAPPTTRPTTGRRVKAGDRFVKS